MRIAAISTSTIPSRTANSIQVMKVCDALCDLDHEVRLWIPASAPKMNWQELASWYGIRNQFQIEWIRSPRVFRRYDFALRAVLAGKRWKANLFYVWPLQAAALAARVNLPTVLEMHDRPQGRFGPLLFRWFLSGRGACRLLPITDALRHFLSSTYQKELTEPFSVLSPMGVDLERYSNLSEPSQARDQLSIPQKFTVGYTGHLYPGRGLDLLYRLAKSNPSIQFLWVGGEPASVQLWKQRLVEDQIENVLLPGFVPNNDLPLYQAACEVLVMPYEQKIATSSGGNTAAFASPMKVFEYMAAGRVIFSSDLPVLMEVLDSSNAIIIPMEDVQAWEKTLREIVNDPERRMSLAKKAKEDVLEYSWQKRTERSLEKLPQGKIIRT